MSISEDKGAKEGSQGVREPVSGVISSSVFKERLVKLIGDPYNRQGNCDDQGQLLGRKTAREVE